MSVRKIAQRAAQEIKDGEVINLGIGIPSLIVNYIPEDLDVLIHSENGILGVSGSASIQNVDTNLIDAGGNYITVSKGASFFDSAVSFAMVRRGKLNTSFMGAFEVDVKGNLANWKIPGKFSPGIGGAMELALKTENIVVLTTHTDKAGRSKIKDACSLPLTAEKCVKRIITEMAVIDVTEEGLSLVEIANDYSLDNVLSATEAPLILSDKLERF